MGATGMVGLAVTPLALKNDRRFLQAGDFESLLGSKFIFENDDNIVEAVLVDLGVSSKNLPAKFERRQSFSLLFKIDSEDRLLGDGLFKMRHSDLRSSECLAVPANSVGDSFAISFS